MTRDGTVGRSDATEPNLAFHRDIDPARMMRPRFADSIRASSPSGLHQQAGHMTASDFCAARRRGGGVAARGARAAARRRAHGMLTRYDAQPHTGLHHVGYEFDWERRIEARPRDVLPEAGG